MLQKILNLAQDKSTSLVKIKSKGVTALAFLHNRRIIMKYNTIINLISKHLADELVGESEMLSYMDRVVDDINIQLNAAFPTFTEFKEQQVAQDSLAVFDLDYTAIPDKYIRTVVIPGAACKYYITDEEGGYASPKYEEDYRQGLFYMVRDYSFSVPEQYRADSQGFVSLQGSDEGLVVPGRNGGLF